MAPVLVRQVRGRIVESEHRGHIVQADSDGRVVRVLGDPDRLVALRSCVKPFGLVALLEAGGIKEFDLGAAEIALMASSHSGEDLHVRTLQGVFRRVAEFCDEEINRTLIIDGILMIREAKSPTLVREMLLAYLPEKHRHAAVDDEQAELATA